MREPFVATVMTYWSMPASGSSDRMIPKGLSFTVHSEPPAHASMISVRPNDLPRWGGALIPPEVWKHPDFVGYSIDLKLDLLATHCEKLA